MKITCECHGRQEIASVCGHVIGKSELPLGFIENCDDPGNLQGWCFACEHVFLEEGDKTSRFESFTQHSVVCASCYESIKLAHAFPSQE